MTPADQRTPEGELLAELDRAANPIPGNVDSYIFEADLFARAAKELRHLRARVAELLGVATALADCLTDKCDIYDMMSDSDAEALNLYDAAIAQRNGETK